MASNTNHLAAGANNTINHLAAPIAPAPEPAPKGRRGAAPAKRTPLDWAEFKKAKKERKLKRNDEVKAALFSSLAALFSWARPRSRPLSRSDRESSGLEPLSKSVTKRARAFETKKAAAAAAAPAVAAEPEPEPEPEQGGEGDAGVMTGVSRGEVPRYVPPPMRG
ncbi:hypothetical protein K505DRAFT_332809 [Melanomma pulvis-pyrius CBS 109.77]|uniref:Uncharacterized protein n=1 Tax=Melanomma pulvis-pyrius CBS 109.77 TaxID=1314802 RepID=A0A6A6XRY5_9PLEO|nr:hypothetical protein K505DRAFT_332809 [Melanomma pulvis-pyrius CBS 109.77]